MLKNQCLKTNPKLEIMKKGNPQADKIETEPEDGEIFQL